MARRCNHVRKGIVTNQDPRQPIDWDTPHASAQCCERPECIANTQSWVASQTNQTAIFYKDPIR